MGLVPARPTTNPSSPKQGNIGRSSTGHILARGFPGAEDGLLRLLSTQTNISAAIIPHCRIFDAVDLAVARICIGTLVLSFKHCEMSSLPPSTPALQRILSGDRQAIMTEVSQIDAAGSVVLGDLLYSDAAVPKAAQKAVDAAEKKAEIARKRAASRTSTATPTKRIYEPKRASQLRLVDEDSQIA